MRFQWLKARQTKYTAYLTVYLLVVIGILVAANWLANRHNWSYDATANKRYSLSDQTQKVDKELKQDAYIRYFDRTSEFQRARDLLDRYASLSPHVKVEYIDPDRKPDVARSYNVRSYGTIYVEVAGRREEAKFLTEEEVTNALIRALKGEQKTVCALRGSGEHSLDDSGRDGYSFAREQLERYNYRTKSISLLEKPEIPEDCTVLMIAGPRLDYPDFVVKAIREFVEKGGSALIMLPPPLKTKEVQIAENKQLLEVLASWGVELHNDLVYDTSPVGQLFGFGRLAPLVSDYSSHPIVREMEDIATAFPLVRSLKAESKEKTTVERLFSSSASSYATTDLTLSPGALNPERDKKGPHDLAAAGTYRTGDDKKEGRFVVVGSSDWMANYVPRVVANRDLFLNMINWLSADEDLISIRPKEPDDRRLALNRRQMANIFWTTLVALPLTIIVIGFVIWWRRR